MVSSQIIEVILFFTGSLQERKFRIKAEDIVYTKKQIKDIVTGTN